MRSGALFLGLLVLCAAPSAFALTQPTGAAIPSAPGCNGGKPTGLAATFACVCDVPNVCNIGDVCSAPGSCPSGKNANCETTLSHAFNDNTCIPSQLSGLDPEKDASLVPETFHPSCALTFTLVTRGTAMFHDVFGWYNVTGSKPSSSDLYPMLVCGDGPGKAVTLDVKSDPRYKGGDVGFFIVTPEGGTSKACGGGDCCPTIARYQSGTGHAYFSERKYNDDNTGPNPFIHLLVFDSKLTARKFYFAWEDIYGGSNDDFTDLLTSVDGVECSGGGEPCDTGKPGRCGRGTKSCKDGVLGCVGLLGPTSEICNGVDDDCNGKIDDGATCATPGDVCWQGRCVKSCVSGEFPCAPGLVCDTSNGLCVPDGCAGTKCADGEVCRGGKCAAVCAGVVCPHGQTCVGDACIDPCAGVTCAAGQICKDGACIAGCTQCGGLACEKGTTCDAASGACVDTSCGSCAAGTYCEGGTCKDACDGAVCPEGLTCSKGKCVDPASVGPQSNGLNGPGDGTTGGGDDFGRSQSGCGCTTAGGAGATMLATLAVVAASIATGVRRRRRSRN
jgi:hypothetical protein